MEDHKFRSIIDKVNITSSEFIYVLDKMDFIYSIEGDMIIIGSNGLSKKGYRDLNHGNINLSALKSLPPNIVFKNTGWIDFESITYVPPGTNFDNGGRVYLDSVTEISPTANFGDYVTDVWIEKLRIKTEEWDLDISGIRDVRILNKMIKDGLFDRQ
jgi:hypothetical protein